MAVIINEFEIIADDNQAADPNRGEANQAPPPAMQVVKPADVEAIIEHQTERNLRLRAH